MLHNLPTTFWPLTDHLPTTFQPPTDHLPTTYRPLTDHLLTTYWPRTDHVFMVQLVQDYPYMWIPRKVSQALKGNADPCKN